MFEIKTIPEVINDAADLIEKNGWFRMNVAPGATKYFPVKDAPSWDRGKYCYCAVTAIVSLNILPSLKIDSIRFLEKALNVLQLDRWNDAQKSPKVVISEMRRVANA